MQEATATLNRFPSIQATTTATRKATIPETGVLVAREFYTFEVEKLGTDTEIREKTGRDPAEWARERTAFLTLQEKEAEKDISIPFSP